MSTIKQLIDECNFGWVYEPIKALMPEYDGTPIVPEVHNFDRYITSEEVIKELDKLGYRPGTLPELLAYQKAYPEDKNWIVALGTKYSLVGASCVPYLFWNGGDRGLVGGRWGDEWDGSRRFVCVRKSLEVSNYASALDDLTLAIELCKKNGLIVTKVY